MSVHIRLTDEELRQYIAEMPEMVSRAVQNAIPTIQAAAAGLTPRRSGRLAGSVEVTAEGYGARVRWTAPYAKYVEHGATPHTIRPRSPRGALRFISRDGEIVFARRVQHPGYPGWGFVSRVRELALGILKQFLQFELQRAGRAG